MHRMRRAHPFRRDFRKKRGCMRGVLNTYWTFAADGEWYDKIAMMDKRERGVKKRPDDDLRSRERGSRIY